MMNKLFGGIGLSILVALLMLGNSVEFAAAAAFDHDLHAALDGTEDLAAIGWAFSSRHGDETKLITVYVDGPKGVGSFIGSTSANLPSLDLTNGTQRIEGKHRFQMLIPPAFRDAKPHTLYAYVVGPGGSETLMSGAPKTFSFACSILVCSTIHVGADGAITIRPVGTPEVVYDHAGDGCKDDIPDVPPRAYRDFTGHVQLISSQITTYRMVGRSLGSLRRPDCKPVMRSRRDPDQSAETYHEWISSTYTIDGRAIYALVHNEWYPSLIDGRCSPELNSRFRVNSITLAVSADAGASFKHPVRYKVLRPGSAWMRAYPCGKGGSDAIYGPAEPTNIVRRGAFLYFMFYQGTDPSLRNEPGVCVARTPDMMRADLFTVWSHGRWASALTEVCQPVSIPAIAGMHSSITYNTYLRQYVLVGTKSYPGDGVYIATSDDLVTWSNPIKILSLSASRIDQGEVRYPVLLDPDDTSRNFEYTGSRPYLYMVLQHDGPNDVDIIRQQIVLSK